VLRNRALDLVMLRWIPAGALPCHHPELESASGTLGGGLLSHAGLVEILPMPIVITSCISPEDPSP
jgi:hypothetical protein